MALLACAGSEERVRSVSEEEYRSSRACWFNASGEFTSFLVAARREGITELLPISGKCLVEPGRRSLALATLRQLGTIDLVDDHGTLRRVFPDFVDGTIVFDRPPLDPGAQPLPAKVYYFRARTTLVRYPGGIAYAPSEILQLDDTNLDLQRFVELDAAGRERLWQVRRVERLNASGGVSVERAPRALSKRNWSGREDSNLRPLPPEDSALPG